MVIFEAPRALTCYGAETCDCCNDQWRPTLTSKCCGATGSNISEITCVCRVIRATSSNEVAIVRAVPESKISLIYPRSKTILNTIHGDAFSH